MEFKSNLLKNTLLGWTALVFIQIFIIWRVIGFDPSFGKINYIFVALALFYTSLLFNSQHIKRNLIKRDKGYEVGGSLSVIFNILLAISFIIIFLALILQESTLLRGPMLLLIAHSYLENNSAIIGKHYMSFGFSVFEKTEITSYAVEEKKQNKSIIKIILNNNRQISITRSKYEVEEIEKLLLNLLERPSAIS